MADGNKNVVLIMGAPNTGKTASLRFLKKQQEIMYINFDLKELSFNDDKFANKIDVPDAVNILGIVDQIEAADSISGAILDTLTFAMSMFERQYVSPHAGSQKGQQAWGDYANHYNALLHKIKSGTKDYFVLAHDMAEYDKEAQKVVSKVPVKGAVGRTGVEADFTYVFTAQVIETKKLQNPKFQNKLLNITEEELEDGEKYVFQTRPYKGTGNTCRSPMGTWDRSELYIDANAQMIKDRIKQTTKQ
jgi:hypothetical protein